MRVAWMLFFGIILSLLSLNLSNRLNISVPVPGYKPPEPSAKVKEVWGKIDRKEVIYEEVIFYIVCLTGMVYMILNEQMNHIKATLKMDCLRVKENISKMMIYILGNLKQDYFKEMAL